MWKGGCGRTTSTANLGAYFANKGYRTLLVDLDTQHNLSLWFDIIEPKSTVFDALIEREPLPIYHLRPNLDLSPSGLKSIGAELEFNLKVQVARTERLAQALEGLPYDIVLIDCSPALNIPTLNALACADLVISPVQAEALSFKGLVHLDQQIKDIFGSEEGINYMFLTMTQTNTKLTRLVEETLNEEFKGRFLKSQIRRNTNLASTPINHETIFEAFPDSNGAKDYKALAEELIKLI